jgi:hypothetical protein
LCLRNRKTRAPIKAKRTAEPPIDTPAMPPGLRVSEEGEGGADGDVWELVLVVVDEEEELVEELDIEEVLMLEGENTLAVLPVAVGPPVLTAPLGPRSV